MKLPKRPDGSVVDWASPILEAWDCSEGAALKLLETFVTEGGEQLASSQLMSEYDSTTVATHACCTSAQVNVAGANPCVGVPSLSQ